MGLEVVTTVVAVVAAVASAASVSLAVYNAATAESADERLKSVALPNQLKGLDNNITKTEAQIAKDKAKGKDTAANESLLADYKALKSQWLNPGGSSDANFASITNKSSGGGAPAPAPVPSSPFTQLSKQATPLFLFALLAAVAWFLFKKKRR